MLEVLSYLTYYSPQVGCHALSRMEPRHHAPVSPAAIPRATHATPPALQISPLLWSVFPRLYEAFQLWAHEYVNNLLTPLDNYISRATETFLTGEVEGVPVTGWPRTVTDVTRDTPGRAPPDDEVDLPLRTLRA